MRTVPTNEAGLDRRFISPTLTSATKGEEA